MWNQVRIGFNNGRLLVEVDSLEQALHLSFNYIIRFPQKYFYVSQHAFNARSQEDTFVRSEISDQYCSCIIILGIGLMIATNSGRNM